MAEQIPLSREQILEQHAAGLQQQVAMLQSIVAQRSIATVDAWIDGLTFLSSMAQAGD